MKFLKVTSTTKLTDVAQIVGPRNVDQFLHINGVPRVPMVGEAFIKSINQTIKDYSGPDTVPSNRQFRQRMSTVLNKFTQDSDIFEEASLLDSEGWKVLSTRDVFPDMMRIPDGVFVASASNIYGNGVPVGKTIYKLALNQIATTGRIDPSIFNEYSTIKPARLIDNIAPKSETFQWFPIPWGDVTIYSSVADEMVSFPVYPESVSDNRRANYTQMPELLYQYEPWQLYQSSGPRQCTYEFDFHRDMWTGDHRDGMANQLIRFCEANCYPQYNGSAVNVATVKLFVKGKLLISGVMTDVSVDWDGPIGLDGFYLHCKLSITIVEVSDVPLNFETVRNMPLIG